MLAWGTFCMKIFFFENKAGALPMYEDIYRERFYPFRFCAETKQAFRQAVTVPALSMWSFQMVCGRGTTCIYQVVGHTGDGGDREVPPQLRMTWRNNTGCRHTILWRPFKSDVPWTGGWKQEQVEMDLIPSRNDVRWSTEFLLLLILSVIDLQSLYEVKYTAVV